MNKRVHQIAKERGLPAKDVLERLQAAGLKVKAVSSSVDEADARRVLDGGDGRPSARRLRTGARQRTRPRSAPAAGQVGKRSARSAPNRDSSPPTRRPLGADAPAARSDAGPARRAPSSEAAARPGGGRAGRLAASQRPRPSAPRATRFRVSARPATPAAGGAW